MIIQQKDYIFKTGFGGPKGINQAKFGQFRGNKWDLEVINQ